VRAVERPWYDRTRQRNSVSWPARVQMSGGDAGEGIR